MELLLSAISSGGLVGMANQYMCLLILAVAARLDLIRLAAPVEFMESWWFIAIVALFWVVTVLPAYSSLLSPGVMNVVNTITNFLSGFVVPISGALLTLASVGVIAEMHPELYHILETLRIFSPDGKSVGAVGWMMAGGGALTATALTGARFLAKPAISTTTGSTASVSAPAYATVENVAALVLMTLAYFLMQVNPWLLVGLLAVMTLAILVILVWAVYQLWRLGKGIGRLVRLIESHPRAGLAVVAEFLVWGSGRLLWGYVVPGLVRLVMWALWLTTLLFLLPALGAGLAAALAPVPPLAFIASMLMVALITAGVVMGLYVGLRCAGSLMAQLQERMAAVSQAATV